MSHGQKQPDERQIEAMRKIATRHADPAVRASARRWLAARGVTVEDTDNEGATE